MLGDIGINQVGGDRRHLIKPGLAKLAFNVIFSCKTKAAMCLQTNIGGLPRSLGSQILRHIGFGAARLTSIKQCTECQIRITYIHLVLLFIDTQKVFGFVFVCVQT